MLKVVIPVIRDMHCQPYINSKIQTLFFFNFSPSAEFPLFIFMVCYIQLCCFCLYSKLMMACLVPSWNSGVTHVTNQRSLAKKRLHSWKHVSIKQINPSITMRTIKSNWTSYQKVVSNTRLVLLICTWSLVCHQLDNLDHQHQRHLLTSAGLQLPRIFSRLLQHSSTLTQLSDWFDCWRNTSDWTTAAVSVSTFWQRPTRIVVRK